MDVSGDVAVRYQVSALLRRGPPVLALERVARGAGSTRWWVLREATDFDAVYVAVRPGSRVHVGPFGAGVHLVSFNESAAAQVREFSRSHDDWFLGTAMEDDREFQPVWLSREELEAALDEVPPGRLLLYGTFPDTDDAAVVTFTRPDADGVVRPQPV